MSAADIRVLFGPGARIELTLLGEPDRAPIDLTGIAEELISWGVTRPRATCPPVEITSYLSVEFGEHGRVLWVDGGGDIDESDVASAIAATLEQATIADWAAIDAQISRRRSERAILGIKTSLGEAGMARRQVRDFLGRRRSSLAGRTIVDVLENDPVTSGTVEMAVELVVNQLVKTSQRTPTADLDAKGRSVEGDREVLGG